MSKCSTCGGNLSPSGKCNICEMLGAASPPGGQQPSTYPMKSMALGVHGTQRAEAYERNRKHGVNVSYDRCGRAVIPDAGEHKKLMKLEGLKQNNAFL